MPRTVAEVVVPSACALGESPTWDHDRQALWWLDVDGQLLHRLDDAGVHHTRPLDARTSAVVVADGGGLVTVSGLAVRRSDADGRTTATLCELPADGDGHANDARCDPRGRLWAGTVDRSGAARAGLFVVDPGGTVTRVRGGVELANGIDWSPDGSTAYFADSLARRVERHRLDDAGNSVATAVLAETDTYPDGLTVDAEGGVWVAMWDGRAVHRYTPDGRLDRVLEIAAGFVTSCAFGGAGLGTLYVTTARAGLGDDELAAFPHSGDLFAADVGVGGAGYTAFGGTRRH